MTGRTVSAAVRRNCGRLANVMIGTRSGHLDFGRYGRRRTRKFTTIEGLGSAAATHPPAARLHREQALQCGYCLRASLMSAAAVETNADPSSREVKEALEGNRAVRLLPMVRAVLRRETRSPQMNQPDALTRLHPKLPVSIAAKTENTSPLLCPPPHPPPSPLPPMAELHQQ